MFAATATITNFSGSYHYDQSPLERAACFAAAKLVAQSHDGHGRAQPKFHIAYATAKKIVAIKERVPMLQALEARTYGPGLTAGAYFEYREELYRYIEDLREVAPRVLSKKAPRSEGLCYLKLFTQDLRWALVQALGRNPDARKIKMLRGLWRRDAEKFAVWQSGADCLHITGTQMRSRAPFDRLMKYPGHYKVGATRGRGGRGRGGAARPPKREPKPLALDAGLQMALRVARERKVDTALARTADRRDSNYKEWLERLADEDLSMSVGASDYDEKMGGLRQELLSLDENKPMLLNKMTDWIMNELTSFRHNWTTKARRAAHYDRWMAEKDEIINWSSLKFDTWSPDELMDFVVVKLGFKANRDDMTKAIEASKDDSEMETDVTQREMAINAVIALETSPYLSGRSVNWAMEHRLEGAREIIRALKLQARISPEDTRAQVLDKAWEAVLYSAQLGDRVEAEVKREAMAMNSWEDMAEFLMKGQVTKPPSAPALGPKSTVTDVLKLARGDGVPSELRKAETSRRNILKPVFSFEKRAEVPDVITTRTLTVYKAEELEPLGYGHFFEDPMGPLKTLEASVAKTLYEREGYHFLVQRVAQRGNAQRDTLKESLIDGLKEWLSSSVHMAALGPCKDWLWVTVENRPAVMKELGPAQLVRVNKGSGLYVIRHFFGTHTLRSLLLQTGASWAPEKLFRAIQQKVGSNGPFEPLAIDRVSKASMRLLVLVKDVSTWQWDLDWNREPGSFHPRFPLLDFSPRIMAEKPHECQVCFNEDHTTFKCPLVDKTIGDTLLVSEATKKWILDQKGVPNSRCTEVFPKPEVEVRRGEKRKAEPTESSFRKRLRLNVETPAPPTPRGQSNVPLTPAVKRVWDKMRVPLRMDPTDAIMEERATTPTPQRPRAASPSFSMATMSPAEEIRADEALKLMQRSFPEVTEARRRAFVMAKKNPDRSFLKAVELLLGNGGNLKDTVDKFLDPRVPGGKKLLERKRREWLAKNQPAPVLPPPSDDDDEVEEVNVVRSDESDDDEDEDVRMRGPQATSRRGGLDRKKRTDPDGGSTAGRSLDGVAASSPSGTNCAKSSTYSQNPPDYRTNCEGVGFEEGRNKEQSHKSPSLQVASLNTRGRWFYGTATLRRAEKAPILEALFRNRGADLLLLVDTHVEAREQMGTTSFLHLEAGTSQRGGLILMAPTGRWSLVEALSLVKGYAVYYKVKDRRGRVVSLLGLYGNNSEGTSTLVTFYDQIRPWVEVYKPDMIIGDFNVSLRRGGPASDDQRRLETQVSSMTRGMTEGRYKGYSYIGPQGSGSCIDRVFTNGDRTRVELIFTGLSDHKALWVTTPLGPAKLGQGPVRMRQIAHKSREWKDHAKKFASLTRDIVDLQDWASWPGLKEWAVKGAPEVTPPRRTAKVEERLDELLIRLQGKEIPTLRELKNMARDSTIPRPLVDAHAIVEQTRDENALDKALKEWDLERERIGKERSWEGVKLFDRRGKVKGSSNMESLLNERGERVTTPRGMGAVAKVFYERLHKATRRTAERASRIEDLMTEIKPHIAAPPNTSGPELDGSDILAALKKAKRRKAPGPDGIPYEWWKFLKDKLGPETDLWDNLARILNNSDQVPGLTEVNLVLLYKKGDKEEMKNYRPISLLNTDYKLLTLSLNERVMENAMITIHKDQAGFIRNRLITDHVYLTRLLTDLKDPSLSGGTILNLDNEKAYDRVEHDYLWACLKTFGIRPDLIDKIRGLYKSPLTHIWVNGYKTTKFTLKRGVRQGDPLSCLLFNYSIEVMAILVRKSRLRGLDIGPGLNQSDIRKSVKIKLFADDTEVYLRSGEKVQTFLDLTSTYRALSGAKYNMDKSEAILVNGGRKDTSSPIPYTDKTSRILGAFVNDGARGATQWSKVIKAIKDEIGFWERTDVSIKGRVLIGKSLLMSRTLYLSISSGIPPETRREIDSLVRTFIMGSKRFFPAPWDHLRCQTDQGGLNMFTLRDRVTATELKFTADLIKDPDKDWATLAWSTLRNNTGSGESKRTANRGLNPLLQKGYIYLKSLPYVLRKAMQTAYEWSIELDPERLTQEGKGSMPLCYHPGLSRQTFRNLKCLDKSTDQGWRRITNHHYWRCDRSRIHTHRRRIARWKDSLKRTVWDPEVESNDLTVKFDGKEVVLNPLTDNPLETLTVCPVRLTSILSRPRDEKRGWIRRCHAPIQKTGPPALVPEAGIPKQQRATVWTDGSSTSNGNTNSVVTSAFWVEEVDLPHMVRWDVPWVMDNNSGEIMALREAIDLVDSAALHVKSDSKIALGLVASLPDLVDGAWEAGPYQNELVDLWEKLKSRRKGLLSFDWVKAHDGTFGNEVADKLAKGAVTAGEIKNADTCGLQPLRLSGRSLKELTKYVMLARTSILATNPARRGKWNRLMEVGEEWWDTSPVPRALASKVWKLTKSPKLNEFVWRWFWRLLPETSKALPDLECPWCKGAYTFEHALFDCGPPGAGDMWRENERDTSLRDINMWDTLPILQEIADNKGEAHSLKWIQRRMIEIAYLYHLEIRKCWFEGQANWFRLETEIRLKEASLQREREAEEAEHRRLRSLAKGPKGDGASRG